MPGTQYNLIRAGSVWGFGADILAPDMQSLPLTTVGGTIVRFDSIILGGVTPRSTMNGFNACFLSEPAPTPVVLPQQPIDPPFPPVWPYLFSTDTIYGRENLNQNLVMIRRDDYTLPVQVIFDGLPADITGGTLRFTAKWNDSDPDASAVIALTSLTSGGITIDNAALGLATIEIPSAATTTLPYSLVNLTYDVQYTTSLGKIKTVMRGGLSILPDVTRTM